MKFFWLGLFLMTASGCSTLTAPVLRHETGENLGSGNFRVLAHFDSSRIFPVVPENSSAATTLQNGTVFTGSLFGVKGEVGVLSIVDLQAEGFAQMSGGGWRLGTKVGIVQLGDFFVAGSLGYGAYSGSGTVTFLTPGYPTDLAQSLSATTTDLSIPISYRISPTFTVYSGFTFYHSEAFGTAGSGGEGVSYTSNDTSVNLGFRIVYGRYFGDVEAAILHLYDPFTGSMRSLPYFGAAIGAAF
jgi:hypothetical protein